MKGESVIMCNLRQFFGLAIKSVFIFLILFVFCQCSVYQQAETSTKNKEKKCYEPIHPTKRYDDYYERGLIYLEKGCFGEAIEDFRDAMKRRSKDNWAIRVGSSRFIDYFPHRELGVAYYLTGKDENLIPAREELEKSLGNCPTAKTLHYLNLVYRKLISKNLLKKEEISKPVIDIKFDDSMGNDPVTISGYVTDRNYITSIDIKSIDGRPVDGQPLFILNNSDDLKRSKNVFIKKQLSLQEDGFVVVEAKNIMGESDKREVKIKINRMGTIVFTDNCKILDAERVAVNGLIMDKHGISNCYINDRKILKTNQQTDIRVSFSEIISNNYDNPIHLLAYNALGNKTAIQIPVEHSPRLFASNANTLIKEFISKNETTNNPSLPTIKIETWINENGMTVQKELESIQSDINVYLMALPILIKIESNKKIDKIKIDNVNIKGEGKKNCSIGYTIQLIDGKEFNIEAINSSGKSEKKIRIKKLSIPVNVRRLKDDLNGVQEDCRSMLQILEESFQCKIDNCPEELKKDKCFEYVTDIKKSVEYIIEIDDKKITALEDEYKSFETKNRYGIFVFPFLPDKNETTLNLSAKSKILRDNLNSYLASNDFMGQPRFQLKTDQPANMPDNITENKIDEIPAIDYDKPEESNWLRENNSRIKIAGKDVRFVIFGKLEKKRYNDISCLSVSSEIFDTEPDETKRIKFETEDGNPYKIDAYIEGVTDSHVLEMAKFLAGKIAVEFPLLVGKIIGPPSNTEINTDLEHDKIKRNYGVIFYKHLDSSSINPSRTTRKPQKKWMANKPADAEITSQDYKVITE